MDDDRSTEPIRKYVEKASPEEQKAFADAFLRSKANREGKDVSGIFVAGARVLWLVVVLLDVLAAGASRELLLSMAFLVLLGAIVWFPVETAAATGRLGGGSPVDRPSHPWVLLVVASLFLLFMGGVAALELLGNS